MAACVCVDTNVSQDTHISSRRICWTFHNLQLIGYLRSLPVNSMVVASPYPEIIKPLSKGYSGLGRICQTYSEITRKRYSNPATRCSLSILSILCIPSVKLCSKDAQGLKSSLETHLGSEVHSSAAFSLTSFSELL